MNIDDILNTRRELAKPMPRNRLLPIMSLFSALARLSEGRATIPELVDAFPSVYDSETMIYNGSGYGLADALDGNPITATSGKLERQEIACELFNTHFWERDGQTIDGIPVDRLLIEKEDFFAISKELWRVFFKSEREISDDEIYPAALPVPSDSQKATIEVDPCDLPPELDAANVAFRAITNGYGEQTATARNRLIGFLEKTYPDFKSEQVQRIATVANPDKSTGRKKSTKE